MKNRVAIFVLGLFTFAARADAQSLNPTFHLAIRNVAPNSSCPAASGPALLTFDEIRQLYDYDQPPPRLLRKLNTLLTTPFVNNEACARGATPLKPVIQGLGPSLIVVEWNIERGLQFDAIRLALSDPHGFARFLEERGSRLDPQEQERVLQEVEILREGDLIILNEVDWGINRTLFRNVADELAGALDMNYAFGVEFVEVDPLTMGIDQSAVVEEVAHAYSIRMRESSEIRARYQKIMEPDRNRYRGLHGTAILSRYPLASARLVPFGFQGHDWFAAEKKRPVKSRSVERKLIGFTFNEQMLRQVRRGGRMMLIADLVGPDLPSGRVTVVATHLEDLSTPASRCKQLEELLRQIRPIENPVLVAGDMNTSAHDAGPPGFSQLVHERLESGSWWAKEAPTGAIRFATPAGWLYELSHKLVGFVREMNDPTGRTIPLLGENPEEKFFSRLEQFRFAGGGAFDFRGDRGRAWNHREGKLANSNERGDKGFVPTLELGRSYGLVGDYKLDWLFVKPPHLADPLDRRQPYVFAPHFGRTMRRLNHSLPQRISDHSPIAVCLPLREPQVPASAR